MKENVYFTGDSPPVPEEKKNRMELHGTQPTKTASLRLTSVTGVTSRSSVNVILQGTLFKPELDARLLHCSVVWSIPEALLVILHPTIKEVLYNTLYKNVDTLMESHDLPRTGSAKWRILSATRVWPLWSNVQISLFQDGSSPPVCPPPSQHSTTARRRFSLPVSWSCSIWRYLSNPMSRSPRTVHSTPSTASQTFSTVSGGAEVEREGEQCETNRMLQTFPLYSDKTDPTNPHDKELPQLTCLDWIR